MKLLTKLTPLAAVMMFSLSTQAEEAPKFSISGFVDMSYTGVDVDGGESANSSGIDQVEINVGYDFGNKLSVHADIEYQNSEEGVDLEQAYINYALTDSFSIKAGRFLSYTGWETEEPTGLYQFSGTGYAPIFYGFYQQGVSALYSGKGYQLAVSVVNDLFDPQASDSENFAIETMVAVNPIESVTIKGFYSVDKQENTDDRELLNLWASYSEGPLTLAVEYNTAENSVFDGSEADGYLLMANYAFEKFALTVRYHDWEVEDASGATFEEVNGITFSPSFSVNENLLMVLEYRIDEVNDVDVDSFAIEALITF